MSQPFDLIREVQMPRVAIFTFGILRQAHGHPQVQEFFDRDPYTFQAAERSDGFIARSGYEDESGPPSWGAQVYPRFFVGDDDDGTPATLSLWEDLESVAAFAYSGVHAEALRRRQKWFCTPAWPTYVAWWVPEAHLPAWTEATKRHEHLHDYGPSPYAFDFQHPFGQEGQQRALNRVLVQVKANRNASRALRARAINGLGNEIESA